MIGGAARSSAVTRGRVFDVGGFGGVEVEFGWGVGGDVDAEPAPRLHRDRVVLLGRFAACGADLDGRSAKAARSAAVCVASRARQDPPACRPRAAIMW